MKGSFLRVESGFLPRKRILKTSPRLLESYSMPRISRLKD